MSVSLVPARFAAVPPEGLFPLSLTESQWIPVGEEKLTTQQATDAKTLGRAETATIISFNEKSGLWERRNTKVRLAKGPFARGSTRLCFKVLEVAGDMETEFVAKFFDPLAIQHKVGEINKQVYFDEAETLKIASKYAKQFNSLNPVNEIEFCQAMVMELDERYGRPICSLETKLEGEFEKHNNNFGGVLSTRSTPQAFSHFTFVASQGDVLVCDIQGTKNSFTDPQIHTKDGKGYGLGNKGELGISRFIRSHTCGAMCAVVGLPRLKRGQRLGEWTDRERQQMLQELLSSKNNGKDSNKTPPVIEHGVTPPLKKLFLVPPPRAAATGTSTTSTTVSSLSLTRTDSWSEDSTVVSSVCSSASTTPQKRSIYCNEASFAGAGSGEEKSQDVEQVIKAKDSELSYLRDQVSCLRHSLKSASAEEIAAARISVRERTLKLQENEFESTKHHIDRQNQQISRRETALLQLRRELQTTSEISGAGTASQMEAVRNKLAQWDRDSEVSNLKATIANLEIELRQSKIDAQASQNALTLSLKEKELALEKSAAAEITPEVSAREREMAAELATMKQKLNDMKLQLEVQADRHQRELQGQKRDLALMHDLREMHSAAVMAATHAQEQLSLHSAKHKIEVETLRQQMETQQLSSAEDCERRIHDAVTSTRAQVTAEVSLSLTSKFEREVEREMASVRESHAETIAMLKQKIQGSDLTRVIGDVEARNKSLMEKIERLKMEKEKALFDLRKQTSILEEVRQQHAAEITEREEEEERKLKPSEILLAVSDVILDVLGEPNLQTSLLRRPEVLGSHIISAAEVSLFRDELRRYLSDIRRRADESAKKIEEQKKTVQLREETVEMQTKHMRLREEALERKELLISQQSAAVTHRKAQYDLLDAQFRSRGAHGGPSEAGDGHHSERGTTNTSMHRGGDRGLDLPINKGHMTDRGTLNHHPSRPSHHTDRGSSNPGHQTERGTRNDRSNFYQNYLPPASLTEPTLHQSLDGFSYSGAEYQSRRTFSPDLRPPPPSSLAMHTVEVMRIESDKGSITFGVADGALAVTDSSPSSSSSESSLKGILERPQNIESACFIGPDETGAKTVGRAISTIPGIPMLQPRDDSKYQSIISSHRAATPASIPSSIRSTAATVAPTSYSASKSNQYRSHISDAPAATSSKRSHNGPVPVYRC